MIEAPILRTERLILRGYRREDFEAIYTIGADAEITRYMGGAIISRSTAWEKFLRGPAMWPMLGYGMWIAERASDGAVLGQIGFADFMREMDPPLADVPEMAWVLGGGGAAGSLGQGYGSEALAAVLAWGDANLSAAKFQCIIAPENIPSLRLAARFGFAEIRRTEYKDVEIVVFERVTGAGAGVGATC
jgi:RimJ/RimL family protein N-acetyltransferase